MQMLFSYLGDFKICCEFDPHVADTQQAYVINFSFLLDLRLRRWAVLFFWALSDFRRKASILPEWVVLLVRRKLFQISHKDPVFGF